jgi:hypothetical protein
MLDEGRTDIHIQSLARIRMEEVRTVLNEGMFYPLENPADCVRQMDSLLLKFRASKDKEVQRKRIQRRLDGMVDAGRLGHDERA